MNSRIAALVLWLGVAASLGGLAGTGDDEKRVLPATSGTPAAKAQRPSETANRRWALLIGIDSFGNGIAALKYATHDAVAVRDALLANPDSGYDADRMVLLDSVRPEHTTKRAILDALRRLAKEVAQDEMLLIFVSTHGLEVDGMPYLVPGDAETGRLPAGLISLSEFIESLDRIPANEQVLVLDACQSGLSRDLTPRIRAWGAGARRVLEAGSIRRVILSSSRADEMSFESEEYGAGVLAHHLRRALGDSRSDRDFDGLLSAEEALSFVRAGIREWSESTGKQQTPWLYSSLDKPMTLLRFRREAVPRPGDVRVGTLTYSYRVLQGEDGNTVVNLSVKVSEIQCREANIEIRYVLGDGQVRTVRKPIRCYLERNGVTLRIASEPNRIEVADTLYDISSGAALGVVRTVLQPSAP